MLGQCWCNILSHSRGALWVRIPQFMFVSLGARCGITKVKRLVFGVVMVGVTGRLRDCPGKRLSPSECRVAYYLMSFGF